MTQSSQQLSAIATQRDGSKLSLWYFNLHGVVLSTRALLAVSGADWSDKLQAFGDEWTTQKKKDAPFGQLPVLYDTSSDGQTIELAERDAIERYIAKKFGLAGDNAWEESLVNQVLSLSNAMFNYWVFRVLYSGPEEQAKALENLKAKTLPDWIRNLEALLVKNGKNGHFVGDKLTHADVHVASVFDFMISVKGHEEVLNKDSAPNLFAVHKNVTSHPNYAAYRKSDKWATFNATQNSWIQPKFDFDLNRSMF